MSYKLEFTKDYHPSKDIIKALEAIGAIDQSWHNDVCPSWSLNGKRLFIDCESPKNREFKEMNSFFLTEYDEDTVYYDGGSFDEAMKIFNTKTLKG